MMALGRSVLSGALLLAAPDGDDRVSTRTATIDLTPAALECDVEPGWLTALGLSRFLRPCIARGQRQPHRRCPRHCRLCHAGAAIIPTFGARSPPAVAAAYE